jgi:hypothetical protein
MAYVDAQVGQYMAQRIIDKVKVVSELDYTPEDVNPGDLRAIVPTDFQLGDIIFWNGIRNKLEKHTLAEVQAEDFPAYDADNFLPIGVVAIPSSHDVYGTGEAMMLGLRIRDFRYPDTGSVTFSGTVYNGCCIANSNGNYLLKTVDKWQRGSYLQDFSAILYSISDNEVSTSIGQFANGTHIGGPATPLETEQSGPGEAVNLDADFNTLVNLDTEATYYYQVASSIDKSNNNAGCYLYAPSPYTADGSKNPLYFDSDPLLLLNQFNGKQLTANAWDLLTIEDWQSPEYTPTDQQITSSFSATAAGSTYTAPLCTWRFHTPGTNQGDWYCPDISEMVYVNVRKSVINNIYSALNTWAGESVACFVDPVDSKIYASSDGFALDIWSQNYNGLRQVRTANASSGCCWPMQVTRLKTLG